MTSQLTSVTNALRVLKAFTSTEREWGVSDLSRHLGISKSSVHRLLATMVEEKVLEQHPITGRYRLGLAVIELAGAVPAQMDLHEALLTPLSELRNRSGETVQAAVLDGRNVVYIERLASPQTSRLFLDIGRRNHAHCTSTGKVLLAHLPDRELDKVLSGWALEPVTERTVTDPHLLRAQLRSIRDQGYAENVEESELRVHSIAAPVFGANGKVAAALSMAGAVDRVGPRRIDCINATREAAAYAGRRLGHRGSGGAQ